VGDRKALKTAKKKARNPRIPMCRPSFSAAVVGVFTEGKERRVEGQTFERGWGTIRWRGCSWGGEAFSMGFKKGPRENCRGDGGKKRGLQRKRWTRKGGRKLRGAVIRIFSSRKWRSFKK